MVAVVAVVDPLTKLPAAVPLVQPLPPSTTHSYLSEALMPPIPTNVTLVLLWMLDSSPTITVLKVSTVEICVAEAEFAVTVTQGEAVVCKTRLVDPPVYIIYIC